MKLYPKKYEDVYTSKRITNRCFWPRIENDIGLTTKKYTNLMRRTIVKMQRQVFENLVKIEWLSRRFIYDGSPRPKPRRNGLKADGAYGVWMRHFVGNENRLIGVDNTYHQIRSYFPDFFPYFLEYDPFKDQKKYKYPYKYMTFEFLVIVHKMNNRIELLDYCEKKKMKYDEFCDFIINWIYSYNEEVGYSFYEWMPNGNYMAYVTSNKYHEKQK